MEELLKERIEVYKEEMSKMLEKLQNEELRNWEEKILTKRYDKHEAVVKELEFILSKIKEN